MGVSTDGILFYGLLLDEDLELPWEDYDFDEYIASKYIEADGISLDEDQFYLFCDQLEVGIDFHCSDSLPLPYVYLKSTHTTASRRFPKRIQNFDVPQDANAKLQRFCEVIGLPIPEKEEIGWWLVSYWG